MASSHREPWLAANEGGRQRLRAKTNCDCGFVKSSVDAKGNSFDMQRSSDCRVRHTYAEWEREAVVVVVAAENWTRGQDEGRWPAG